MINFLNGNLKPSVKCSAVADDLHTPDNLISLDLKKQNIGFMAYSVTKPPMDLIFNMICPVDIHYIKIWPNLGALKTTGLEIQLKNDTDFIKAGFSYNKDTCCGIAFYRSDYYQKHEIHKLAIPENFVKVPLQNTKYLMPGMSQLKLTIKTTAKCVCVLQKIEIWGQPARKCTKEQKDEVKRLWDKVINVAIDEEEHSNESNSSKIEEEHNQLDFHNVEIPDEFLDSITYEIMQQPMILPSGKIVDQSTIDKHNKLEESYGRMISDPFTAQPFTELRKPIFDPVLKTKIDRFLIINQNLNEIKMVPRTLGGGAVVKSSKMQTTQQPLQIPQCSKFIQMHDNKRLKIDEKLEEDNLNHNNENNSLSDTENNPNQNSLDLAVYNALKNITRFSKVKKSDNTKIINVINCFNCKTTNLLYTINICHHLICRNCLLKLKLNKCTECDLIFEHKNVVKYHS